MSFLSDSYAPSDPPARRALLAGIVAAAATVGQLVFGKAVRDAFFLASFDVKLLPRMVLVSAGVSFVSVLGVSRAMARFSPFRVTPALFALSSGALLLDGLLSLSWPQGAAVGLHLHMAAFGSTVVSGFWSLVNERYDPHTAKRVVGPLTAGTTMGGIIGSFIAWQASMHLGVPTLLVLMALMNGLCFACVLVFAQGAGSGVRPAVPPVQEPSATALSGLRTLFQARYLRHLGLLVVLSAISSALIEYLLSARAVANYSNSGQLLSFFGRLQLGIGLLSFLVLTLLCRPSLKRLGLAGTVALLPGTLALGCVGVLAVPGLWSLLTVRVTDAVMQNSLFRSGYELLYTPLAPEQKRSTKLLIDVGMDRIGTVLGSGLTMLVVYLALRSSEPTLLVIVVGVGLLGLWTARRLHDGYVHALEESLRAGAMQLDPQGQDTEAVLQTLTQTNLTLDRREILAEIERLRQPSSSSPLSRTSQYGSAAVALATSQKMRAADPMVLAVADLRSADPARVRSVLGSEQAKDPALVGHLVPLLAHDALLGELVRVLRELAPRVTGQLLDALLDASTPVVVRRRLPRVLKDCASQRAAYGLLQGLADSNFAVRYQCGLALVTICERNPQLELDSKTVLAAAQRELEADRALWTEPHSQDWGESDDALLVEGERKRRKNRALEHVFNVLSLTLERGPLMLAFRFLESGDPRMRGTALEYLENVLPTGLQSRLWPYLNDARAHRPPKRPKHEILDELLRSASALPVAELGKTRGEGHK